MKLLIPLALALLSAGGLFAHPPICSTIGSVSTCYEFKNSNGAPGLPDIVQVSISTTDSQISGFVVIGELVLGTREYGPQYRGFFQQVENSAPNNGPNVFTVKIPEGFATVQLDTLVVIPRRDDSPLHFISPPQPH